MSRSVTSLSYARLCHVLIHQQVLAKYEPSEFYDKIVLHWILLQTDHTCRNQYTVQQHRFKGTVYVHVYKIMKFQIKTCTKVNVHITVHLQQCKNFSVALYNFIEHVHVHNSRDYQCRVNRLSNSQRVCMVLEHFTGRVNYSTLKYITCLQTVYIL